jgi:hypothetical protein
VFYVVISLAISVPAVNSERVNLIASEAVVATNTAHWGDRQMVSVPFTRRKDWCRRPEVADFKSESWP